MVSTTVANRNAAGAPTPSPEPTTIGVLNSIAEIGADPVTVRNSTPARPTACFLSLWTSSRPEMSTLSARPLVPARPGSAESPPVGGAWVSDMRPASLSGIGPVPDARSLARGAVPCPSRARGSAGCSDDGAHGRGDAGPVGASTGTVLTRWATPGARGSDGRCFWSDHDDRHYPS